jgi:ubiquinone/menaquinone biosynthesis C-methylase UbiE
MRPNAQPGEQSMSPHRNQVIETYSELAGKYDDQGNVQSCWTVHSDHIVASLNLKSRFQTVAEVGCGTGRALHTLASRSHPAVRFVGVEPAEDMRRRALELNRSNSNVRIVEGTFETLPLEPASVDYVFSVDAFHWARPHLAVREMARVLKPAGEMDHFFNGRNIGREFIQATTPVYMKYMGLRYLVEAAGMRHRFTKEETLALFGETFGPDRVQVHETYKTYFDTVDGHLGWWVRLEGQLLAIPVERRKECEREIRAALAALETDQGIPYTIHQLHVQVR